MMGSGSYNYDWGYYFASPPSNLSAFAVPFSVNRPSSSDVSAPFVGFANSADAVPQNPNHCPVQSRYDLFSEALRRLDSSMPSSEPHEYSGVQGVDSSGQGDTLGLDSKDAYSYDQCSNGRKSSHVETQPYFPSYVSPIIHYPTTPSVAPSHWPSFSGFAAMDGPSSIGDYAKNSHESGFAGQSAELCNQFQELNHRKGKQVGIESGSSSEHPIITSSMVERRMNLGCQDVKDSNIGEVAYMVDWEKHGADQLDDKSHWWGTIKSMPVEFSGTSVVQSPSISPETHHEAPLMLVADSGNHHLSCTDTNDKDLRQHDKSTGIDAVSSTPMTGLVPDLNIDNLIAGVDFGLDNFHKIKEAHHMSSPGTAGSFDSGHLHMHLERNEFSSSNLLSDKNVPRDVVVDHAFKARLGLQNSHPSVDNLSLRLGATEEFNSVEKSFESGDRGNLAVDSPCWKGVPAAHFSRHEYSESLHSEYVQNNNKEFFGSVIQGPPNFLLGTENNVQKSYENSNSCQMHNGIVNQEKSSAGSLRKFSVTKVTPEDCKSVGAANVRSFQSEPSCEYWLQYLDDIPKLKENSVPPTKSMDCESGSSHTKRQDAKVNKLMLCIDGADTGCKVNKWLESGASHTAEHDLSSPSLGVVAPTTSEKSSAKVSTEKLNVQMLVDMMQNLSELLLDHCFNDACELIERDCSILKNVVNNLNACASKKAEQITSAKECHQPETSRCSGESHELQQNASFKRPQLIKTGPESSKVELEDLLVREANTYFKSEKPQWNLSDSISPRADAEMAKAHNMTKAIKRILSENFHDDEGAESETILYKNLWLEAEAALCSVNYKARYNQMKIEMEKHLCKKRDMMEQSNADIVPSSSKSQSSAAEVYNYLSPDFSALHSPLPDMNEPHAWTPEGKGSQDLNSFIQDYFVSQTNKKVAGNEEASVMARYLVLKARVDNPCFSTSNLEEPSDIAAKLALGEKDNQNQVNFHQESPVTGKNKADDEASVLARFHILKSRLEDSSAAFSEGELLDGVEFAGKGTDDTMITKNASSENKSFDVHVNLALNLDSYTAVDKSSPKEYHLDMEDNQEIEPYRTSEFQNSTPHSDGLASDWEHVE